MLTVVGSAPVSEEPKLSQWRVRFTAVGTVTQALAQVAAQRAPRLVRTLRW